MSWVEVHNFSYTYPGEQQSALRNINLSVKKHAFVVVTGMSGSGKSTLGKALAGFLFQDEQPVYSGKIIVNGTDMAEIPLFKASERVAYVQQNPEDQFCTLTVLDEIAFALENACLPPDVIEQRIDQALSIVKGTELKDRFLSTLSGGEKQKIAIAAMLALEPDVLILDEPTSNLDPSATQHVFKTLHAIRAQKDLTVIIIEHKLAQLMTFNPEFIYLDKGQITAHNPLLEPVKELTVTGRQEKPSHHQEPIVEVNDLDVHLNGHPILQDIHLNIYPGEFIALMGPNGSGKSTLLQTLMGFHKPEQGTIRIQDQDLAQRKTSALVNHIGYIFQNPDHQLFTQSVWDEAVLTLKALDLLTLEAQQNAIELLSEIGLHARIQNHPQRLSFGEKRRLNLVGVILHHPQLLLIDEFLIGQDMYNAYKWMRMLKEFTAQSVSILLAIHHAELTQAYCDRVIFIDAGKKTLDAPIASAFSQLDNTEWAAFLPLEDSLHA